MTKKILMHITLILNILMIILYAFLSFASFNQAEIYEGKKGLSVEKPSDMTNSEFVQSILMSAFSLKSDIMYYRVNENYEYEFYKTNIHENFLDLPTSSGTTIVEEGKLISTRDGESGKIYGFVIFGSHIEVHYIGDLKQLGIDLSDGTFYVEEGLTDSWINKFQLMGASCTFSNQARMLGFSSTIPIIIAFFSFLLFVSVVFLAFSKARDFTIKKSIGYTNLDISLEELRNNLRQSVLEFVILIVASFILFSFLYGFISSLLFVAQMIPMMILLFFILQVVIFLSVFIVSDRCKVHHIKGHTHDKAVFRVATLFKVIVFVLLIVYTTNISDLFITTYQQYTVAKAISETVDGYAQTRIADEVANPLNDSTKHLTELLDFYLKLNEEKNAIVASMDQAYYFYMEEYRGEDLPHVYVNGNYLDFCDSIFDIGGNQITSADLLDGKHNVLVPAGYDTDKINSLRIVNNGYGSENMNFIEYSDNSEFFTFSMDASSDNGGYCQNVVAWIYDPVLEAETMSATYVADGLISFMSASLFFPYDTSCNQSPYEQIQDIIQDTNTSNIIVSAPSVKDALMLKLSGMRDQLIILFILLVILIGSFLYLLVYASELYFLNHAKDISVKLMHGHTLLDICTERLLLKASILPALAVLGLFAKVSMPLTFVTVFLELLLFYLLMCKHSQKNITSIIKGQV